LEGMVGSRTSGGTKKVFEEAFGVQEDGGERNSGTETSFGREEGNGVRGVGTDLQVPRDLCLQAQAPRLKWGRKGKGMVENGGW